MKGLLDDGKYFARVAGAVFLCLFIGFSAVFPVTAYAQVLPGAADISRLPQNMKKTPEVPPAPPHAAVQPPPPQMAVPPGADKMTFVLRELDIDGVTAYGHGELESLWRKDIGKTISVLRVYEIAAAITARYRQDGYFLSRAFVPAQAIGDSGVAHISVVEGFIADVHFAGKVPQSRLLDEVTNRLTHQRPANIRELERQMLLLNDFPGEDFRAVLKPLAEENPAPPAPVPRPVYGPPLPPPQPAPNVPISENAVRPAAPVADANMQSLQQPGADADTSSLIAAIASAPPQVPQRGRPALTVVTTDSAQDMETLEALAKESARRIVPLLPAAQIRPQDLQPGAGTPLPPQADATRIAADQGGALLVIVGTPKPGVQAYISADNTGSRYIGPYMLNAHANITTKALPYQQTGLTLSSDAGNELRNIEVSHLMPLTANGLKLFANIGYTRGQPGFTLAADDVQSRTLRMGAGIGWDVVRQRTENLNLYTGLDYQNADTDVLGLPFVRDHTRILKLMGHFDRQDSYAGTSVFETTLSHGLEILGASSPGSPLLSRAKGRPDFTKVEASAYRYQNISADWNAVAGVSGQYSAVPLLSAEEFGYGGPAFGRAYDPSELVGDQGIAFKTELRYDGFEDLYEHRHVQPYLFYDIGKVWNLDPGEPAQASGSSAGIGLRYPLPYGINADFTLAQPLTRARADPQYGNGKSPRFLFSITSAFPP